ncbi:uncharacterized protein LOC130994531 [Salvia miltiorrhiza]|uniref:uncharacterized protein LOC130994531 n=1 Tax=Salvia miltiorrhiza TaxID=226208 RepID=UPI0025ABBFC3|nr:uncharacterized protein LOC130994531 [Salvia miltiorrhiza]
MALLLAASAAAAAAKRRLPILTSFYARLRSSTCYFERRDEEKIYRDGEKIYGAPPEDLENEDIETCVFDFQSLLRGRAIPAPCISETKCTLHLSLHSLIYLGLFAK